MLNSGKQRKLTRQPFFFVVVVFQNFIVSYISNERKIYHIRVMTKKISQTLVSSIIQSQVKGERVTTLVGVGVVSHHTACHLK